MEGDPIYAKAGLEGFVRVRDTADRPAETDCMSACDVLYCTHLIPIEDMMMKKSEASALKIVPYSDEKQQVVSLLVELQEHLVSVDGENVQTIDDEYGEKYFAYLQRLVKNNDGIILLAVSDGEVDGFIAGYIEPKDEEDAITNRCPRRGIIADLAVTAPRRKSGIGKKLMNALESYFMEKDCEFAAVDLFAPNGSAGKFYGSLGYAPRNIELYKRLKR